MSINATLSPIQENSKGKIVKVETANSVHYYVYSANGKLLGTKANYFAADAMLNAQ